MRTVNDQITLQNCFKDKQQDKYSRVKTKQAHKQSKNQDPTLKHKQQTKILKSECCAPGLRSLPQQTKTIKKHKPHGHNPPTVARSD